jgi:NAD(P)-dependent dehydrogenase (short-subunit alcohol dehydrogenase family)
VTGAFDLTDHVALITGGNSGIGLGYAEGLAAAGASIAIWGTNEGKNLAAAEQLRSHGRPVVGLCCDVGDEAQVDDAFARTVEVLGRVDSCFANAGTNRASPFVDMTLDDWRAVLRVNLDGAFLTFRAAARHMVERGGGGSLVATGSLSSIVGQPRGEHYAASKGAVVTLVKSLSVELARHGIRANAVLPGWVDTALAAPVLHWDRFIERVLPRVPMRRWGRPDDFGAVAVYLASPASAYHTGDTLVIDGGYSLF